MINDKQIKNENLDWGNFNANVQFLENTGLLNGDGNAKILEIGCGAGKLINHLTLRECNTIGFDIDRNAIIEGRVRFPDKTMFLASGTTIPFQNSSFEIAKNKSLTHHKSYHCSLQTLWTLKKLLKAHKFKYQFVKIPVMNEFMERKIEKVFGHVGVCLLRFVNPDRLPLPMRTNFYICAARK